LLSGPAVDERKINKTVPMRLNKATKISTISKEICQVIQENDFVDSKARKRTMKRKKNTHAVVVVSKPT